VLCQGRAASLAVGQEVTAINFYIKTGRICAHAMLPFTGPGPSAHVIRQTRLFAATRVSDLIFLK
jgi:hypothetical protein